MTDREKLAHEAWNVWDLDHHMANKPNEITAAKITACVAAAIAAAEERGRRSAETERDELRALLREEMERQHYVAAPGPESEDMDLCGGCGNAWPCEDADCFVFKARALLAPRDSAPARYCSAEHPDRPLRCGRFVQHDGPHTAYDPDYSFENRTAVHWEDRK